MRPALSERIARAVMIAILVSAAGSGIAAGEPAATPPTAPEPPPVASESELSHLPRTIETAEREPSGLYPPAPPEGEARTISAALSLGPGWLALRDAQGRDGQGSTSLAARLGLVVAPEWCVFLGVDRSSTDRGGATFAQTAAILGAQRYFLGRLYLGGGLAMAMVKESGVPDGLSDGPGFGFSAIAGVEALKTRHAALTGELSLTMAKYSRETWEMGGLRLGVLFY